MSDQDFNENVTLAESFSDTDTLVGSFDDKTEIYMQETTEIHTHKGTEIQTHEGAKLCTHEVTIRDGKNIRKGRYQPYEDTQLIRLYKKLKDQHKNNVFAMIEQIMDRTAKSLRERYCNHLDERIDSSELLPAEKTRIYELYHMLGNRPVHAEIARLLSEGREDGRRRTDLIVRNFLSPKLKKNKESSTRIKDMMDLNTLIHKDDEMDPDNSINNDKVGTTNLANKDEMKPVGLVKKPVGLINKEDEMSQANPMNEENKMDLNNLLIKQDGRE
ncbi:10344_t:CDS:2 [Dentiscutata erythropus]|uniref:10344_t:CDS:1 n=1 Tax=Dentiscutata erythropus TaxID=1348616 RepID=A0A9N9DV66_9GLOM|nr:10344_t:CDS:2 [Dentiscutata erythropus]